MSWGTWWVRHRALGRDVGVLQSGKDRRIWLSGEIREGFAGRNFQIFDLCFEKEMIEWTTFTNKEISPPKIWIYVFFQKIASQNPVSILSMTTTDYAKEIFIPFIGVYTF